MFSTVPRVTCRCSSSFAITRFFGTFKHEYEPEAASMPTQTYARSKKSRKKRPMVFGFGFSGTGCLGVKEFLLPRGKNHPGQLLQVHKPCQVPFSSKLTVSNIACGNAFSLFSVKSQSPRKLYCCGLNNSGQIGYHPHRTNSDQEKIYLVDPQPIDIFFDDPKTGRIHDISCGRVHSLIATNEGVFSLGNNAQGQCGRDMEDNETVKQKAPFKIRGLHGTVVKQVVCGWDHSLVLTEDGRVFSFGGGKMGQLGTGTFKSTSNAAEVKGDIAGEEIVKLTSTCDTVLALNSKGEVFGWGSSEYRQLSVAIGDEPQANEPRFLPLKLGKIKDVAAGSSVCGVVTESGNVFTWGFGFQIGQGPERTSLLRPSLIPPPIFGATAFDPSVRVASIHFGAKHCAAITERGDLYTWGSNEFGQLGHGKRKDQYFPLRVCSAGEIYKVALGSTHSLIISKFMF